jgi:hypothetical protein
MTMVLGLRCTNSGYCFAVMTGTKQSPVIKHSDTVSAPKGYPKPQKLGWMQQEVHDLCRRHQIHVICMKGTEGLAARGAGFVERVELEAVVFLAANHLGIKRVVKKVKSTLAKDLGQKGKARYLAALDTRAFPGFATMSKNKQEAIYAAWTELPS